MGARQRPSVSCIDFVARGENGPTTQSWNDGTSEPRKLVIVAGGHHRSVQHDPELQGESLRWIERRLGWLRDPER